MKKGYKIGIASVMAVIGLLFVISAIPINSPTEIGVYGGVGYKATVCPTITRANGEVEVIECTHNVLTFAGMNATRSLLGAGGATSAFDYIELECGTHNASVFNTTLSEPCTSDLARAQGTYIVNSLEAGGLESQGNWSIYHVFTSDITDEVFGAGLFNASSADTLLAVANFTTSASLEANDQLTVNWTITIG